MPADQSATEPLSFTTFGVLLRYLRRRARLTQRDLGIAVGYSEGHINRFEKNKRLPDSATVAALFIPALDLRYEPELAARLVELAALTQTGAPDTAQEPAARAEIEIALEPIPPAAPHEIRRTGLLARLRTRLAQERRVVLCGLPGVGKTTLAGHVAREYAATMPVFWLTLTEGVTTSVEALMRQLALFLVANGQDQVKPLVAADPSVKIALSLDQQIALMGSALTRQPALLCFDNAELIQRDEACLQVLRHLCATTPVFLLLTTRESLPLTNIAEITIDGFECEEGVAFITQSAHHALDEKLAERLLEKTDGSPMLLQLALGQLLDQHAGAESFIARLETQPQVAAYLLQTVQKQLSPGAWRWLLLLAVFQQPVNLYDPYLVERVNALGGIENIGEAIAELQRRRLIGDAAYAHLHPLVRDYVYLTLNAQVVLRQRLHRLAADWFGDKNQDAFMAAFHYTHAGLLDSALDMIEDNKCTIVGRGQALSAVALLDEVQVQLKRLRTDRTERLRRLLTLRGTLLMGTLRVAEGEANLRQAMALASSPAVRANVILELASLISQRSNFREALQLMQLAKAELAPGDLVLRARLASLESAAYESLGDPEAAAHAAHEALALSDQLVEWPQSVVGEIRARAQGELAACARARRDLTAAMHHAQAATATARAAGAQRAAVLYLTFIGGLYYDQGNLEDAFRYRQEGLEGLLAIGDVHSAAYILNQLADIHHLWRQETQALEKLAQASDTLRIVGDMRGLAGSESSRASSLLWCGQVQEARHVIEQLLAETRGESTERLWGYRLRKQAMVQLVQGEMSTALTALREALNLPSARAHRMLYFELRNTHAFALAAAGDPDAAARILADTPRMEGLSRWANLDRDLFEGYVALAQGDRDAAYGWANQVLQRADQYALYRQCAVQLMYAIQEAVPVGEFPRLLWVECECSPWPDA